VCIEETSRGDLPLDGEGGYCTADLLGKAKKVRDRKKPLLRESDRGDDAAEHLLDLRIDLVLERFFCHAQGVLNGEC